MSHKLLSLELFGDKYLFLAGPEPDLEAEYTLEKETLLSYLRNIIEYELTEKQKFCIRRYYFEGKSMREIAKELGITEPTVSRHLKKARLRLENSVRYMGYMEKRRAGR